MQQPEIAQLLTACGVAVFPCWDNKTPAIIDGHHGATVNIDKFSWPSSYVGIPVPENIFIIDLDLYKGITTSIVDERLGCELDWVNSIIQLTPSGGAHYAFRVGDISMHQRTNWFNKEIGKGFDTRSYPKGYVCTGSQYKPGDGVGLYKLLTPESLPELPPEAVELLKTVNDLPVGDTDLPVGDKNISEIQKMLSYLDADCGRDEWMTALRGLRHHFHDNDPVGWALFNEWSMTATGLNSQGTPMYDAKVAAHQWRTTNPLPKSGGKPVTLSSLADLAIQNGYVPSSVAADVFGGAGVKEDSADLQTVETLIAQINADGGKPEQLDTLTSAIRELTCNSIQRAALTATLQRTLRDHGIKITEKELKQATAPQSMSPLILPQAVSSVTSFRDLKVSPIQALGNVHIQNAGMLRQAIFGDRLARFGGEVYWWTGGQWEKVSKADLNAAVAYSFIGSEFGKDSTIKGTYNQLINTLPSHQVLSPPSRNVFFKNGVFNPMRPDLGIQPHDPANMNGSTLRVDYTPGVPHPEWNKFLQSMFFSEMDRCELLQEVMGWWLISDNLNHQKAVAFDGVSRSGKGTIFRVVEAVIGGGLTDISLDQLIDNKNLSSLRTANLAIDRDAKRPQPRNMSTVHSQFNKITANEPIAIPLLHIQDPWHGELNCKLAIGCNGIPIMADDSGAAPGRWLVLKFTKSFLGEEDLTLMDRLYAEIPAITAWAIEGLRRLIQNGQFTMPQSSIEESHALFETSSPLAQFADERLEVGPEYKTHGCQLWDSYRQWCKDTNNNPPTKQQFLRSLERALQDKGVHYKRAVKINGIARTGLIGCQLANCIDGVTNVTHIGQALKEAPVK